MNGDKPEKRVTEVVQPSASVPPSNPTPITQLPPLEQDSPWQYNAAGLTSSAPTDELQNLQSAASTEMVWTASEFVAHHKGPMWYVGLAVFTIALDTLLYIWSRDLLNTIALAIFAILFGIIAARKPKVVEYRLSAQGVSIGPRAYSFSDFKSFSIIDDGAFSSIRFLPIKRFMPPVSIFYEPKDEERILQALAQYLPMEHREHDLSDRLIRRIRF